MHIGKVYFRLVAQVAGNLLSLFDGSRRLGNSCGSILVVSPQSIDQGFDRIQFATPSRQLCREEVNYQDMMSVKNTRARWNLHHGRIEYVRWRTALIFGLRRIDRSHAKRFSWYLSTISNARSTTRSNNASRSRDGSADARRIVCGVRSRL